MFIALQYAIVRVRSGQSWKLGTPIIHMGTSLLSWVNQQEARSAAEQLRLRYGLSKLYVTNKPMSHITVQLLNVRISYFSEFSYSTNSSSQYLILIYRLVFFVLIIFTLHSNAGIPFCNLQSFGSAACITLVLFWFFAIGVLHV